MLSGLLTLVYNEISYSDVLQIHDSVFGFFLFIYFSLVCRSSACIYVYASNACLALTEAKKRASGSLKLELQTAVTDPVGAGN